MIVATWVGIGLILVLNVIGWFFAYNRYSRNAAHSWVIALKSGRNHLSPGGEP